MDTSKFSFKPCALFFLLITLSVSCTKAPATKTGKTTKPNIVIFYVDDLGYGDVGCYGATRVSTPNIDKLASGGVRFTDGHSTAATCTPSRYSLLTGEYAFRNNAAILPGDAPLLIDTNQPTLPKMLQKAGYKTAVVGKWHLGLGDGAIDWNTDVKPGPLEVGFDYSFLLPATGDRVPTVYLENYKVVNLAKDDALRVSYKKKIGDRPTGRENPELLRYPADGQHSSTIVNGVSRIGFMAGGGSAEWVDEEFPQVFTGKANEFIDSAGDNPFFLFFSFHDIHVPRLPHDTFRGTTEMGVRGDVIVQMDWTVGEVMGMLRKKGLEKNTLVIFTSDNGPVLKDGYEDEAVDLLGDHQPAGIFRGGKYSAYEAGTRVPTITYWPGVIAAVESGALMSQVDIYASLASLVEEDLEEGEAVDSENILGALLGKSTIGRETLLEESETLALRKRHWKYIRPIPPGSRIPRWIDRGKNIESGLMHEPQLYHLAEDPGEEKNLAPDHPEIVAAMEKELEDIVQGVTH